VLVLLDTTLHQHTLRASKTVEQRARKHGNSVATHFVTWSLQRHSMNSFTDQTIYLALHIGHACRPCMSTIISAIISAIISVLPSDITPSTHGDTCADTEFSETAPLVESGVLQTR
jgi:hypothetical protein